jgi:hypothetical protein
VKLFRKKAPTWDETARKLAILTSEIHNRKTLQGMVDTANRSGAFISDADSLAKYASLDFLAFGFYLVRNIASQCLRASSSNRDALLDEFFKVSYSLLTASGFTDLHLMMFQTDVQKRFECYDSAGADSEKLIDLVASRLLSSTVDRYGEFRLFFIFALSGHVVAFSQLVRKTIDEN